MGAFMDWFKSMFNWPQIILLILVFVAVVYLIFYLNKPTVKHFTYKSTPQGDMTMRVYFPKEHSANDQRPVILFFFGGGWIGGGMDHFRKQAEYLSKRGMVAALVDYRIDSKHHTTPDMAVSDGLDAMKWMAENAAQLGIDIQKIIASGSSAGGHIAACLALCQINQTEIKPMVRPSLLILFNPVLDLTNATAELEFSPRELELIEAIGPEMARAISPNQHISSNTPPSLLIFGDKDPLTQQSDIFREKAIKYGVLVKTAIAENQKHGFFNKEPWKGATILVMDNYLIENGYLPGPLKEPSNNTALSIF
jgi:acetyl esterase/lipase